jgi:hypothetical protein
VTTPTEALASGVAPEVSGSVWHTLSADQVLQAEQVDGQRGLSAAEVALRASGSARTGSPRARWIPVARVPPSVRLPDADRPAGASVLTLFLATVFGPLQAFLKTTTLDVQQWLTCTGTALSIIVAAEIRKAIRRWAAREGAPAEAPRPAPEMAPA